MEFADLDQAELVVFVALAKAIARADAVLSQQEFDWLQATATRIGQSRFDAALATAREVLANDESMWVAAGGFTSPAKRRFVYERLVELGAVDGLVDPERALLERLAEAWHLGQ